MAFERGERGYREPYPRRGEGERYRRDRVEDDETYGQIPDDELEYTRPSERRHWRGHDYVREDEFERGREYRGRDFTGYERPRDLRPEHRERFLRSSQPESFRSSREAGAARWQTQDVWNESRGPYAGRGPKGYHRSDERIHEDICERLTEHPSIDASDIEITVNNGDVTLTGRVESRAVKHLTEVMVETVSGVKDIHNQLRIAAPESGSRGDASEARPASRPQEAPRNRRRV